MKQKTVCTQLKLLWLQHWANKMNIKLKILSFVTITMTLIISFTSCKDQEEAPSGFIKEYKTTTGKTIIVSESHPVGQGLSNIRINTRDLEYNPVTDVFIADLDKNGFDEIYIITTSADSGSYGNVLGFASNKDKSLSMINFPDLQYNNELFKGYMGHDTFSIENNKLIRTFAVFNKGDSNQKPTGGKRKLIYGLYLGEAMWQLTIEN
jgi:hypothetical protein